MIDQNIYISISISITVRRVHDNHLIQTLLKHTLETNNSVNHTLHCELYMAKVQHSRQGGETCLLRVEHQTIRSTESTTTEAWDHPTPVLSIMQMTTPRGPEPCQLDHATATVRGGSSAGGGGRKYERRVMQPPPVGQAAYYAPAPSSRERRHTRGGGGAHQLARPWWSQVPFRGPVVGP